MFKKYRMKAGLTQEELAEMIEISWRQMQRIETKKNEPSVKTLRKLIMVLKIKDKDVLKYLKDTNWKKANAKKKSSKKNSKPKEKVKENEEN